jgi:hypothetical protein
MFETKKVARVAAGEITKSVISSPRSFAMDMLIGVGGGESHFIKKSGRTNVGSCESEIVVHRK